MMLDLHCRCGVSFVAPVHESLRDRFVANFWLIHSGLLHGEISPFEAAIAHAHRDALLEDVRRDLDRDVRRAS